MVGVSIDGLWCLRPSVLAGNEAFEIDPTRGPARNSGSLRPKQQPLGWDWLEAGQTALGPVDSRCTSRGQTWESDLGAGSIEMIGLSVNLTGFLVVRNRESKDCNLGY